MAGGTGIGIRTYQRPENDELPTVHLWYLVNCAVLLDCRIEELMEDEWLRFHERWEDPRYYRWLGPDRAGARRGSRRASLPLRRLVS